MSNTTPAVANRTTRKADQQEAVQIALAGLVKGRLGKREFSTGSKGFFGQDKIEAGGRRYQAQAQAVLIGSKGNPKMRAMATDDQVKAAIIASLIDKGVPAREFSSGKSGFRAQGKVQVGDETYQASVQAFLLEK
jgi:hypothetical protein